MFASSLAGCGTLMLLLGVLLFGAGCAQLTGTSTQPRHIACTGKGSVVGSVSGFAGVNVAIDCGDGLTFDMGPDPIAPAPAPVKP
jgi:hypothetical protein